QVLCVASTAHEHLVGHLGKEHRLSGPQDLVDARRRARIWWIPAAQLSGKVDLRRIDMGDDDLAWLVALRGELDRGPVGQPRNSKLGNRCERGAIVEVGHEDRARFGEEPLALERDLLLRDVHARANETARLALLVEECAAADGDPPPDAVRGAD